MTDFQFPRIPNGRPVVAMSEDHGTPDERPDLDPPNVDMPAESGVLRSLGQGTAQLSDFNLEIVFLCDRCEAELAIDFRRHGRLIDCPCCYHMIQVPRWSAAEVHIVTTVDTPGPESRLSPEELAYLSAPGLSP